MFKYKCINNIAEIGLRRFPEGFEQVGETDAADAILVRSAKMHDMVFEPELKAIARAGAGVNNIPLERCAEEGIVVFNSPGANANAVKELFVFSAILSLRDVVGGIEWTRANASNPDIAELTEKEKKRFVGHEVIGKKLGVLGLGNIGAKVANIAIELGMEVMGYDAFLNDAMKAALKPQVKIAEGLDEIAAFADMITVHVPAMPSTAGYIGEDFLSKANDGLVVINLARDTLVDAAALKAAMETGRVSRYICDFPTAETAVLPGTILIPHLGASTEEAEENCAIMAVDELVEFLVNGNIINSVNFPRVDMGPKNGTRVTVIHKPSLEASKLAELYKAGGFNITDMTSKVRDNVAYTVFDGTGEAADVSAEGIIRTRVLK
ncbi:MAG: 3-phosphoglycerate dehydrogenase [Parasporobacterium sp.]|nr:3-phosphoglycerate dehydrogenase [Parasporobacterium sp.]